MLNTAPFETLVGYADVFHAPVGEPFPNINDAPAGNWDPVGALNAERFGEKGVLIRGPRDFTEIMALATTTSIKDVITRTGFEIEFDQLDQTMEAMALGVGLDPTTGVTTVAAGGGDPGQKSIIIPTSPIPFQRAILVRAPSPYMANGNLQIEITAANQVGPMELGFTKSNAAFVTHLWKAVKTASGFVTIRAQHEAVSP